MFYESEIENTFQEWNLGTNLLYVHSFVGRSNEGLQGGSMALFRMGKIGEEKLDKKKVQGKGKGLLVINYYHRLPVDFGRRHSFPQTLLNPLICMEGSKTCFIFKVHFVYIYPNE